MNEVPDADATARRILLVDDNHDAADSLATLLGLLGHEVHVAYDGSQALELAQTLRPQMILMDIGLPGLTGHDVARLLRAQDWTRSVMLVAITGWGSPEDRRRSSEAGFDHHLVKPVLLEDLVKLVGAAPAIKDGFNSAL